MRPMRLTRWQLRLTVLRKQGITIRKTIDTLIATYCIESGSPSCMQIKISSHFNSF
ncbi:hypothetical protein [Methylomonas sp. AM2-LC]|uniref:hypothetical protein n=1 Tax=Methylomonas sp. AM2-LC TaxID=3153301 RepID=UPI003266FFD5